MFTHLKYTLLFFLTLSLPRLAYAQTIDDTGLWLATFGNGKFKSLEESSPFRWWFDNHLRFADDAEGFNQSIIRPGLGYALSDGHALWAGYAWIRTSPIVGDDFDEHRKWQQWTLNQSVSNLNILHRSRLEERWVETGEDIGLRWRQMLRGQWVLTSVPQWSLIAWDEAFFHLNDTDWGAETGFDQNRAFLGVGFKRCPHARVRTEIGYLNQFVNRPGDEERMTHILSLNWFY
jgi:hypothetical protein